MQLELGTQSGLGCLVRHLVRECDAGATPLLGQVHRRVGRVEAGDRVVRQRERDPDARGDHDFHRADPQWPAQSGVQHLGERDRFAGIVDLLSQHHELVCRGAATVSAGRTVLRSRAPISVSTSSPVSWPNDSLMSLK